MGDTSAQFVNRLAPGQEPEFSTQSNRPGIGAHFMDEVASTLLYAHDDIEDVPGSLRDNATMKMRPLGRYLRQQLRKKMGRDPAAPESVKEKLANEMQPVRDLAWNGAILSDGSKTHSLRKVVKDLYAPETARLEALETFNYKRKKL